VTGKERRAYLRERAGAQPPLDRHIAAKMAQLKGN